MEVLEPIPTRRVVDSVRASLRSAILQGELEPGERLSVPELARQLGVSRSPVREAVLQLVAEGLAVEQSRRGVAVAHVAPHDLDEIYQLREVVEGLAARLGARRLTNGDLQDLRALVDAQSLASAGLDGRAYRELDQRFHHLIADRSGNTRVVQIASRHAAEIRLAARALASSQPYQQRGIADHRGIVEALAARDGDRAETAMRAHLRRVWSDIREHLQNNPNPANPPRGATPRQEST